MYWYEIVAALFALVGVGMVVVSFALFLRMYGRRERRAIEGGERDAELKEGAKRDHSRAAAGRIWSRIKTVAFWLLVIIFVPLIVLLVITRINGGRLVARKGIMAVATGSMSVINPANSRLADSWSEEGFGQYSIIVLDRVDDPCEIELYDILAYKNDDGFTIIHRVVAIDGDGDGVRYTMRGDANDLNDDYRPAFSDVVGKYSGDNVEYLGAVVLFIQSGAGLITVAGLVILILIWDGTFRRIEQCRAARLKAIAPAGEENDRG